MRILPFVLAGTLLALTPSEACGPHFPMPPAPTPSPGGPPAPARLRLGDYSVWWYLNRDENLLSLKPHEDAELYENPPDTLPELLSLVGYDDHFPSLVKALGLRRLKRFQHVSTKLSAVLQDPKAAPDQRAWAAYALGDLRCLAALKTLAQSLSDKDRDVRAFSARALGLLDLDEAYEALIPLAQDPKEDADVRCMALLSLARSRQPAPREALAQVLRKDRDTSVRRAAVLALSVQASPSETELVAKACGDHDAHVRAAAVLGLGLIGKDVAALRKFLRNQGDETVRAFTALSMGLAKSPEAVPDLLKALKTDDSGLVKACAALSLGRIGSDEAFEDLRKAQLDPNTPPFVSAYTAIGLGLTGREEASSILGEALLSGGDSNATHSCAVGLALLGKPSAVDAMTEGLDQCPCKLTHHCLFVGLGKIRQASSFDRILAGLSEEDESGRQGAAIALAVFGDPKAVPALEPMTDLMDAALAYDLLTSDPRKPLTVARKLSFERTRKAGPRELTLLLNAHLPEDFKLPISP